jgi:RNA polymerase sigma factor (sigma-70 family)
MESSDPLGARCVTIVGCLAEAEHWVLSADEQRTLAAQACSLLTPASSDTQIRTVLLNIHRDQATVEALRCNDQLHHGEAWSEWLGQAQAILHHAGLDWARDDSVDLEDLAQIALLELARSLPSYRYASRFSTWAYQVITRGVQRHLRDMAAKKRAVEVDRDTDPLERAVPVSEAELPEHQTRDNMLSALVEHELSTAFGPRNATVFQLWARDDYSAEMIGRQVGLSTARIHAIIAQARQYLRGQETIQHWYEVRTS